MAIHITNCSPNKNYLIDLTVHNRSSPHFKCRCSFNLDSVNVRSDPKKVKMFLHREVVDTIFTLCTHFNISDEVLFSCLDTYERYAEILYIRLKKDAKRQRLDNPAMDLFTRYENRSSNIARDTFWPSILMVISLCTKTIEGIRSGNYISYRRFSMLLQRCNMTPTFAQLRQIEFRVFKNLQFTVTTSIGISPWLIFEFINMFQ